MGGLQCYNVGYNTHAFAFRQSGMESLGSKQRALLVHLRQAQQGRGAPWDAVGHGDSFVDVAERTGIIPHASADFAPNRNLDEAT